MTALEHEELMELLGAYALDAVEPDEREEIERHLTTCPRCRAEVAEHREVAAMLAHVGAPAPDGLWDRILGSLEEAPPKLRLAAQPGAPAVRPVVGQRSRAVRWAAAVVAIAAALVIVVLSVQVVRLSDDIDRIGREQALDVAANRAFDDPSALQARLRTESGVVEAVAVVKPSGEGYLLARNLPALDGRVYQLWGINGDVIVSLGVLGDDPGIVAFTTDPSIPLLAITVEAEPVAQPSTTPVVSGTLA